ncbi:chemotaxis protein CheX [Caenimonas soli]|uniref:chemotaxis protein CheX n=1 Tax=Caenimonas soli TaxID=2735555 RepID=UPI001551CC6F|nr:chemotaxis protein CheX [Caenimonas soli]NPC54437.1 chemotaxis protein CheX [Caenimonas soli]
MSAARLKAEDIKIFSDAAGSFFEQTTRKRASVRTAYLLDSQDVVVWDDYQGLIELDGKYQGSVAFSAPRGLLSHVLLLMGESDYSDASHRDIVGEIANQMSGYARRHFGESMEISPPKVLTGRAEPTGRAGAAVPFVIPMAWERYEAHLVVRMHFKA